jgi:hypothetical protein
MEKIGTRSALIALPVLAFACNSNEFGPVSDAGRPFAASGPDGGVPVSFGGGDDPFFAGDGGLLPAPTFGNTQSAPIAPPPITGGTMAISKSGRFAIVADPDRDLISAVDLTSHQVRWQTPLQTGDRPGRIAEDSATRLHVVLRGSGTIATIDLTTGTVIARRAACTAPRGIAYDGMRDNIWVSCAEGQMIAFAPIGDARLSSITVVPDLRDIVVVGSLLYVSQFRKAQIAVIDPMGNVSLNLSPNANSAEAPAVGWRMIPLRDGRIALSHQIDSNAAIQAMSQNAYGANSGPCGASIVEGAISTMNPMATGPGAVATSHLSKTVLPVDVAEAPVSGVFAIAAAGNAFSPELTSVVIAAPPQGFSDCAFTQPVNMATQGEVVSVAFDGGDRLYAQVREPSALVVLTNMGPGFGYQETQSIPLSGDSREDTGHAIFHTAAGASLACASCHPEGMDDGRVWNFNPIGPRRTPPLLGTIQGTAPYHWDGSLPDMSSLIHVIYEGRMAGAPLTDMQKTALTNWVLSLPPPNALPASDLIALERGETLFQGKGGCIACHSGARFTNNQTLDVGTGGAFQVPSLIGVGWRMSFIHDGCASSLTERFDPMCGGASHGNISQLNAQDVSDLIVFLRTL